MLWSLYPPWPLTPAIPGPFKMSLRGPRRSYLSGLAVSNRSESEAQSVVGSVVFLAKTLDSPGLRSCTHADRDWVPAASLQTPRACVPQVPTEGTTERPLPVPCPYKFELLRASLLERVGPGPDGPGLGTDWGHSPEAFCRSCTAEYSCSFVPPASCLVL